MRASGGLARRLNRTFVVQALAISAAAIVGMALVAFILQDVLVTQALHNEAEYFWSQRARDSSTAPPDTQNLTGYLAVDGRSDAVPEQFIAFEPGYHDIDGGELDSGADFTMVYVSDRGPHRLYLAFDGGRVAELVFYFGLVPLGVVLVALYVSMLLVYRAARRAVSPITRLARAVNRIDIEAFDSSSFADAELPADVDDEARILADALRRLGERVRAFVEREKHFTRDASHELRTPLTVIRMAADVLQSEIAQRPQSRESLERIQRSVTDMEELVDAFLMLAREDEVTSTAGPASLNDVVRTQIERIASAGRAQSVAIDLDEQRQVLVVGNAKMLGVAVGNLLQNAMRYTDNGRIAVTISADAVTISDTGRGMDADTLARVFAPFFRSAEQEGRKGYGVGLAIVKRICDRNGWGVTLSSELGKGTQAELRFPEAIAE